MRSILAPFFQEKPKKKLIIDALHIDVPYLLYYTIPHNHNHSIHCNVKHVKTNLT